MESDLFQECLDTLGSNVTVLSSEESTNIVTIFTQHAPIYRGGSRIDWNLVSKKTNLKSAELIIPALNRLVSDKIDFSIYVFWNDATLPVLKTTIDAVLTHLDDVTCLGFETWLYNPVQQYVIEFYYLGDINVGLLDEKK